VFKHAIVRTPGSNFAQGLTTVELGVPRYDQVLEQHARYCAALRACGLTMTTLEPDLDHPDSTFVEDTAVLTAHSAILARPGARSREGEVAAMSPVIRSFFSSVLTIEAPGTLDGGDICEADDHFFVGVSHRTSEEGARQLAAHLAGAGYTSSVIDVRGMDNILHLKSGISYIGNNILVVMEEMAELFAGYELVRRELCSKLRSRQ
jgi:dimethylargininase